uniref:transposase n=1 Tax=Streptomyces sp. ND04-05B TaxID=3028693 RepID=UPI0039F603B4
MAQQYPARGHRHAATYRAAIRTSLPNAVVDHFHIVQLANKTLSPVRRRTTAEIRDRR